MPTEPSSNKMTHNRFISTLLAVALAAAAWSCSSSNNEEPINPATPEEPALGSKTPTEIIFQANPRFYATDNCFAAIKAEVNRIAGMGCNVLWIMPSCEMGEERAFGSPYCIRDFKATNPKYGTMADFTALVDAAHAAGMKVILDWIANHTAWDHEWITQHPERYKRDASGNIQQASTWTDVAQLDFSNKDTHEAMADAMLFWVNEGKVDGFRCDYAEGVPHSFWSDVIERIRAVNPNALMLAETSKYDFYNDGFDMIYDWNYAPAAAKAFTGGKPSSLLSKAIETFADVPEGKSILRYVFNHDSAAENNVATYYGSIDALPAAYVLTALLHGTPMIYSSMDASGMSGKLSFFNYNPLTWSQALSDKYAAINSIFKATAEVRRGELKTYNDTKAAIFSRSTGSQDMIVMVNTTADKHTVKVPIAFAGSSMKCLSGDGATTKLPTVIELEPYGFAVYMN